MRAVGSVSYWAPGGVAGWSCTERQYGHWFRDRTKKASVYTIPTSTSGTLSSEVSMAFQLHGQSHVDLDRIHQFNGRNLYACDAIVSNHADIIVTARRRCSLWLLESFAGFV